MARYNDGTAGGGVGADRDAGDGAGRFIDLDGLRGADGVFGGEPGGDVLHGSNLTGVVRVHVTVTNASAAGSVQLQASNSTGSGTVTIKANSDVVGRRTG